MEGKYYCSAPNWLISEKVDKRTSHGRLEKEKEAKGAPERSGVITIPGCMHNIQPTTRHGDKSRETGNWWQDQIAYSYPTKRTNESVHEKTDP